MVAAFVHWVDQTIKNEAFSVFVLSDFSHNTHWWSLRSVNVTGSVHNLHTDKIDITPSQYKRFSIAIVSMLACWCHQADLMQIIGSIIQICCFIRFKPILRSDNALSENQPCNSCCMFRPSPIKLWSSLCIVVQQYNKVSIVQECNRPQQTVPYNTLQGYHYFQPKNVIENAVLKICYCTDRKLLLKYLTFNQKYL